MNVFVKTKLSQLGIKMSMRLGSWVTNPVGLKVKLCLTCLSICVTEPAVCGNEDRLLWTCLQLYPDPGSLETKFWEIVWADEEGMGEFPKHIRSNISGRVSYNDETRAAGAHRQFLQFFSDVLDEGWWNAVTHNFRKFVVWQTACSCRVPLTINLIFLRETSKKMSESGGAGILIFELGRIRCPPPPPFTKRWSDIWDGQNRWIGWSCRQRVRRNRETIVKIGRDHSIGLKFIYI